jgi:hypothetical protein
MFTSDKYQNNRSLHQPQVQKVGSTPTMVSIVLGVIGSLVLGLGMSCPRQLFVLVIS